MNKLLRKGDPRHAKAMVVRRIKLNDGRKADPTPHVSKHAKGHMPKKARNK